MAEPSSARKRPKTPSGHSRPSTDRPGGIGTLKLSCDPAALAPGAQRRFVTRSFHHSVRRPKMRPRALTKGRRMQRGSSSVSPLRGAQLSVSHKLCVECGKMLGASTGYVNSKSQRTGKLYLNSACRPYHNHRVNVVTKLKQKHPRPPAGTPCECCGRVSKLFLDHSHDTDTFRGWICRECNSSIGLMGDSVEGVRKALTYLETRSTQAAQPRCSAA